MGRRHNRQTQRLPTVLWDVQWIISPKSLQDISAKKLCRFTQEGFYLLYQHVCRILYQLCSGIQPIPIDRLRTGDFTTRVYLTWPTEGSSRTFLGAAATQLNSIYNPCVIGVSYMRLRGMTSQMESNRGMLSMSYHSTREQVAGYHCAAAGLPSSIPSLTHQIKSAMEN